MALKKIRTSLFSFRSLQNRKMLFAFSFLLGFFVFLVDFFTKAYVDQHLPLLSYAHPYYPSGGIAVFQNWQGIDFSINHVINSGAAWGVFASFQDLLLCFRICVIIAMVLFLLFFNKESAKVFPFILIVAGASGNVADYFIYGHVVDMFMFHFKFWNYTYPIFNVADSAIFCGIAWLFIQTLKRSKKQRSSIQKQKQS